MTREKLGERLFFETLLSSDSSISCASCHQPEFAFADTLPFSIGVGGRLGKRNTPSAMNMSSREIFFFDGRAATLELQSTFPIQDHNEMNLPVAEAVTRLQSHPQYLQWFKEVYGMAPNVKNLQASLAAYERTLETSATPNDRWLNDEENGLTEAQIRGREVFFNKGKCIECHFTPDFTGDEFRNIGLFNGHALNDSGRYSITRNVDDLGKFKVPGLRNVAVTAPYMHDGSYKTLREVIDYYDDPDKFVEHSINRDSLLSGPLKLTEQEKLDLEAFLHGLTDDRFTKK